MKENLKEVYTQRTDSCDMANSVEFTALMNKYKCAIMEVETKLNVLDAEFSLNYDRNPFESIETRLKSPASIMEKLKRKGFEPTLENIEKNLFDVAGIRVVCAFQEDIYKLAELLTGQDDIRLLRTKDYIQHPKENGYRSLHSDSGGPDLSGRRKGIYESGGAVPYDRHGFLGKRGSPSPLQKGDR